MTPAHAVDVALNHCKRFADKGCLGYAVTYLMAMDQAEQMSQQIHNDPEIGRKMQVNYALGNMQAWRGEQAREVKEVLKAYVSDKVGWNDNYVAPPKKGAK